MRDPRWQIIIIIFEKRKFITRRVFRLISSNFEVWNIYGGPFEIIRFLWFEAVCSRTILLSLSLFFTKGHNSANFGHMSSNFVTWQICESLSQFKNLPLIFTLFQHTHGVDSIIAKLPSAHKKRNNHQGTHPFRVSIKGEWWNYHSILDCNANFIYHKNSDGYKGNTKND